MATHHLMERRNPRDTNGATRHNADRMMSPALLHSLNHPLRRQILRILSKDTKARGPSEMTRRVAFNLPSVAYHARYMAKQGIIRCVGTERVKGGVVRFYLSSVKGNQLVEKILSETETDDSYVRRF